MKKLSLIIVFLYCLFLAGCRGQDQTFDEITPTITPISTVTVTSTEWPEATQTAIPSLPPTILPHQLAITAQNASKIVLIEEFGSPAPKKLFGHNKLILFICLVIRKSRLWIQLLFNCCKLLTLKSK